MEKHEGKIIMSKCQFCDAELSMYEEEESPKTNIHPTCEHCWNRIEYWGKDPDELKCQLTHHLSNIDEEIND